MDDTRLIACHRDDAPRCLDVVFVHGLKGDAGATWQGVDSAGAATCWPRWLAEDFPEGVGVWLAGYPSSITGMAGRAMSIPSLAGNLAHRMHNQGIGERPVVFVGHSMGGLIIKQFMVDAAIYANAGLTGLWRNALAVAFLGTPHTGSDLPSMQAYLRDGLAAAVAAMSGAIGGTVAAGVAAPIVRRLSDWFFNRSNAAELERDAAALVALNKAFQQHMARRWGAGDGPSIVAYRETQPTHGMMVVDTGSADPGIVQAQVVDVPFNHVDMCKLSDRRAAPYEWLAKQVREALASASPSIRRIGTVLVCYAASGTSADRVAHELIGWIAMQGVSVVSPLDIPWGRAPQGGWAQWLADQVAAAETVLLLADSALCARAASAGPHQSPGDCVGPDYGPLQIQKLIDAAGPKLIIVLPDDCLTSQMPGPLRDHWNGARFPGGGDHLRLALQAPPCLLGQESP